MVLVSVVGARVVCKKVESLFVADDVTVVVVFLVPYLVVFVGIEEVSMIGEEIVSVSKHEQVTFIPLSFISGFILTVCLSTNLSSLLI